MNADINNADQFFGIAEGFFKQHEWVEAAHFFRKTIIEEPNHHKARLMLAEVLHEQGEFEEGLQVVEPAFFSEAKLGRGIYTRLLTAQGLNFEKERRNDEALKFAERALEVDPNYGEAYKLKMRVLHHEGDTALAKDHFDAAAEAYRSAGDEGRANQLDRMHRWKIEADLESRARSLELEERWSEAVKLYEELLSIAADGEVKQSWRLSAKRCREEKDLAVMFQTGLKALDRYEWGTAKETFLNLVARRPDYNRAGRYATELLDQVIKTESSRLFSGIPTRSPVPLAPAPIGIDNVRRMIRLARFGDGRIGPAHLTGDGKVLLVASSTGVHIYDYQKLTRIRFIDADDWVISMAVTQGGDMVATGFRDGGISVWRVGDGALLYKLRGHTKAVNALGFSYTGEFLFSASDDGSIRMWDAQKGKFIRMSGNMLDAIKGLVVSPVGNWLAHYAHSGSTFWVNQFPTFATSRAYDGEQEKVLSLAFSGDGEMIAAAGGDGSLCVWPSLNSEEAATPVRVESVPENITISALTIAPGGHQLAIGSQGHTIHLIDWPSGTLLHILGDNTSASLGGGLKNNTGVFSLSFTTEGSEIISSGSDDVLNIWDAQIGELLGKLDHFNGAIHNIAFSPNSLELAAASDDGAISLWQVSKGAMVRSLKPHLGPALAIAFHPGGVLLASAGSDHLVRLHNLMTGEAREIPAPASGEIHSLRFNLEGSMLAAGFEDGGVVIWRTEDYAALFNRQGHPGRINQVRFSPGGMMLATAGTDGAVRVWLTSTGFCIQAIEGLGEQVTALEFSPGGDVLVAGLADGFIWIWETTTEWNLRRTFKAQTGPVTALAFSLDGSVMASASEDGKLCFWQADRDVLQLALAAHSGPVARLAFSNDGTLLASASLDGTIRLWGVVGN